MKKLMLLAAMLALVVVAASPAFAQSGSSIEVEEGNVEVSDSTTVEGSIVQNCPATVSFGDENANVQVVSGAQNALIEIDGDENAVAIEQALTQSGFSPEVATTCAQEIAQAAAAGGGEAKAEAGGAKAEAKAGEAPKAEAKAGGAQAQSGGGSAKAQLPATGGASLFALGAGALLVGGGLVARRIIK